MQRHRCAACAYEKRYRDALEALALSFQEVIGEDDEEPLVPRAGPGMLDRKSALHSLSITCRKCESEACIPLDPEGPQADRLTTEARCPACGDQLWNGGDDTGACQGAVQCETRPEQPVLTCHPAWTWAWTSPSPGPAAHSRKRGHRSSIQHFVRG